MSPQKLIKMEYTRIAYATCFYSKGLGKGENQGIAMERFTRSFRGTQMSQCDHRLSNSNNVKRRGHLFAYKYLQFSIASGSSVLESV